MSTLHTVNKSPFERNALQTCVAHLSAGDSVLMFEDAVVGARKGSSAAALVEAAAQTGKVYVLSADMAARGLKTDDIVPGAQVVDYGDFVDLVTGHDRTVAWL
ncbi:MAG: sulfurtransferase complex subunit TusB [Alphaproteobacteria bacterium]